MTTGRDWKDQLKEIHDESYSWSLFCCNKDEEMAKDTLQTVYLKVYEGKARFLRKSTLKSWLFSVIRNTAIDLLKRNGRGHVELSSDHNQIADEHPPADFERERLLKKILNGLSDQQHAVLTLAFYHDLTLEEVAEALGISIGSARTHYERGKENFRKYLAEHKNLELL